MANLLTNGEISPAVKNFESLPDSAHIRAANLEKLLDRSRTTIWRMVRSGALPQPRKIGNHLIGWNVGELRRALAGE